MPTFNFYTFSRVVSLQHTPYRNLPGVLLLLAASCWPVASLAETTASSDTPTTSSSSASPPATADQTSASSSPAATDKNSLEPYRYITHEGSSPRKPMSPAEKKHADDEVKAASHNLNDRSGTSVPVYEAAGRHILSPRRSQDRVAKDLPPDYFQRLYGSSIKNRAYLTGDWGGVRSALADKGITFDFTYTSEIGHNWRGGASQGTANAQQIQLATTLDMDKLIKWKDATFQLTYTKHPGKSLSVVSGLNSLEQVQEIYEQDNHWLLTQLWVNQTFKDDTWELKYGRMSMGEDFANFSCDFMNLTFCSAQPSNMVSDYWYNWPLSLWATRLLYNYNDNNYVQTGIYQINTPYVQGEYDNSRSWQLTLPSGTHGVIIPVEYGKNVYPRNYPGTYKFGAWVTSTKGQDLYTNTAGLPLGLYGGTPVRRNRYGGYINFSQQLTGKNADEGLNAYLNVAWANQTTAALNFQAMLVFEYDAPFGRKNDTLGLAFGTTHMNRRETDYLNQQVSLPGATPGQVIYAGYERVSEIFYNFAPVPSINLRPNIQHIVPAVQDNPTGHIWLAGLKSIVQF